MRVVHDQKRVGLRRDLGHLGQGCEIALHTVHAIDDNDLVPGIGFVQQRGQRFDVVMPEKRDMCIAHRRAVANGRMAIRVADEAVCLSSQRRSAADVRLVATGKEQAGLSLEELG